jgi:UDP-glucuronate decarboxylase
VNPIGIRACYDEGKRAAETLFFDYWRQYKTQIKVARIFNTYGPRMDLNDGRVVSNFAVQALKNEPLTIYGDGSQTRSFCYVSDLIPGLISLMETPDEITGPINLGNPNEFTMLELANQIIAASASKSKISYSDLPSDDPKQRKPDISKARTILNWEPQVQLQQGLEKTISYFAAQLKNS